MKRSRRRGIAQPDRQPEPGPPFWTPRLRRLWVLIGLCAATLLAYSNSFNSGFSLDSRGILLEDRIRAATWDNLQLILGHTYWWPYGESGLYRPIATLSYLFNYAVLGNGDRPAGYHAINFLLHAGNVLLVYLLALRLLKTGWKAFAAAALWAVHPVLTESVTNIAGRPDLLAGLAVLSGLWMYLKSAESRGVRRWAWLGGLLLAAMFGVFSKENAVVLAGVMALLELTWWEERKRGRALALGCLAVLPALVAMAYQRAALLSKLPPVEIPFLDNPLTAAGFWTAKLTAVRLLAKYLGLLVWPAHLSWDYSYAQLPLVTGSLADWAGWMAVAAVCVVAFLAYRSERTVFFAIGFAFVTFLPTSNLVLPVGTILAERFLYLPAVALAICLVVAADALGRKTGYSRMAPVVLGVIGVILAARTWARNADWRDSVTVTTAGVEASPNSYKTHGALALALFDADPEHANLDPAIAEAEKGLAILNRLPDERMNSEAFRQAADYYLAKGNLLAIGDADHSMLTPESRQAYQRELQLLLRSQSIVEASYRGSTARARARGAPLPGLDVPKFVEREDAISAAYLRLGDPAQSAAAASDAIARAPQTAESYRLLAAAWLVDGKAEDAAIALFEGLLATSDMDLRSKLETLYQNGLVGQGGCAMVAGPNGPRINPSCEIVRRHACLAAARLIPVYTGIERRDLAIQLQGKVGAAFGCR
jgi:hypothetical protein